MITTTSGLNTSAAQDSQRGGGICWTIGRQCGGELSAPWGERDAREGVEKGAALAVCVLVHRDRPTPRLEHLQTQASTIGRVAAARCGGLGLTLTQSEKSENLKLVQVCVVAPWLITTSTWLATGMV